MRSFAEQTVHMRFGWIAVSAVLFSLAGGTAGYRAGTGAWPFPATPAPGAERSAAVTSVTLRFDGYIGKPFVNAPEQLAREGEPPGDHVILDTNWH